ncbi:MAG: hypothetical protein R3C24_19080 [Cyanobacteriota/Melainabacteria group bacterium]
MQRTQKSLCLKTNKGNRRNQIWHRDHGTNQKKLYPVEPVLRIRPEQAEKSNKQNSKEDSNT